MKKILKGILGLAVLSLSAISMASCGEDNNQTKPVDVEKETNDNKNEEDNNQKEKVRTNAEMAAFQKGFDYEGRIVPDSFDLYTSFDYALGKVNVEWKSNSVCLEIGKDSIATSHKTFGNRKVVILTATYSYTPNGNIYPLDTYTTTYSVYVQEIKVDDFAEKLVFPYDEAYIDTDLELPTKIDYTDVLGKSEFATIDWNIRSGDEYAKLSTTNDKLLLEDVSQPSNISLEAVIKYNEQISNKILYNITNVKMSPEAIFKNNYDGAADKIKGTVTGYVLAKAGKSVYNEKGQCCLYIASDTYGPGAYYAYNCYMDEADYDALQVGDFVTVKNAQFQSYNGIIEACYGDVVRDTSKKISAEEVANKTQDITADVETTTNLETTLFYKQSNRVKIRSAKIKSITSEAYKNTKGRYLSSTQNVLTLEVNGNAISLVLQEGVTGFADEATKAIFDSLITLEVGSYIEVEGILSGTEAIIIESVNSCKKVNS